MLKKVMKYYSNGKPKEEYSIDPFTGILHGKAKYWHKNGQLWKKCHFNHGVLHHTYEEYNQRGEMFEFSKFDNGKLVYSRH